MKIIKRSGAEVIFDPEKIIIAETEIWPCFISLAKQLGVKVYCINGRISPHSFDGYKKIKLFLAPILNRYEKIFMQSSSDMQRMIEIGAKAEKTEVMGNLNEQDWEELWNSESAENVRRKVRCCDRNCWMIGSVSPAMHKYIHKPALWVVKHKFLRFFKKKKYSMYENKIVRDFRDGKITKEELDKCSTCERCARTI